MFKFLTKWAATGFAVFLVTYIVTGVEVRSFGTALFVGLVLGFLNLLVRPILFIITLPITLITLGLFTFFLNAFLFQFAAHLVEGFYVHSFAAAFWASLLVSFISWLLQLSVRSSDGRRTIRVETYSGGRRYRDLNA